LYSLRTFYLTLLQDEEKAKDRDARSSGRNTPTRRTPRGSTDRLANSDIADSTDKACKYSVY